MKTALASLSALVMGLVLGWPAQAQFFHRNRIINSGNGAYNTIAVQNHSFGGSPYCSPIYGAAPVGGGYGYGAPVGYGGYNGYGSPVGYGGYGGYGAAPMPYPQQLGFPGGGGVNKNIISNSANGQGNAINIQNGGGFSYNYPGSWYGGTYVG